MFGEVGYVLLVGLVVIELFVGFVYVNLYIDGYMEIGGVVVLCVGGEMIYVGFLMFGLCVVL